MVYDGAPYCFKANPKYGRDEDEWGMKVYTDTDDQPPLGATVRVVTKSGSERTERVGKVIWSGENQFGEGWVHACKFQKEGDNSGMVEKEFFQVGLKAAGEHLLAGNVEKAGEVFVAMANDLGFDQPEARSQGVESEAPVADDDPVPF